MNCIDEKDIRKDDRKSLEEDGSVTAVIQIFNDQHLGVEVLGNM